MTIDQPTKITKALGIATFSLAIIVILIDYFFTNEIKIESTFVVFAVGLLIINIALIILKKSILLRTPFMLLLFGMNAYSTAILAILWWGFGFTGQIMSYNMMLTYFVNVLIYICMLRLISSKSKY